MRIDYRDINKFSINNRYPLPKIDDLSDYLKHAKLFTKLDLKLGYHHIPMESSYVSKIGFKTREGLFEWLVMHFVLTNTPANFMGYIDDVLIPFSRKSVIV